MNGMRYKHKVLEKLEDNERKPLTEKINKYNVAEDLWKILEENDVVYLRHCCDNEFQNKYPLEKYV